MYQQPPPSQSQQFQPPYPPFVQQPVPRQNPKGYAVTSLILFIVAGLLHILALIPYLGIFFGCMGLICDLIALIFLILVVASL
jgi:hypothetical protein